MMSDIARRHGIKVLVALDSARGGLPVAAGTGDARAPIAETQCAG